MDHTTERLSAAEQTLLRALRQRKMRQRQKRFLAEGVRVVEDLLASRCTVRLLVATSSVEDTPRGRLLLELAAGRRVPLRRVTLPELQSYAATEHPQGVVAVADVPEAALHQLASGEESSVVLVLDGVQDPGNFGSLVRTAEALGARGVVALPGTVDPWNPKSIRSAAGSAFRLPIVENDWETVGPWLRDHEFVIFAAAAGADPLGSPPRRAALVVGNEGAGISAETLARADRAVGIPLRGRAESLNVAAAAAILLHQLLG